MSQKAIYILREESSGRIRRLQLSRRHNPRLQGWPKYRQAFFFVGLFAGFHTGFYRGGDRRYAVFSYHTVYEYFDLM